MTSVGWGRGGGTEQRESGLMDVDNSVVIAGGREGIRGLNSNEKKYNTYF